MAMKWNSDALHVVRELDTNCSDFIYEAAEFIAQQRQHESVKVEDVNCVLAFIAANSETPGA
jgi:hypothetical protein